MPRSISKSRLLKQMGACFPDRWEVERLESRLEGENVLGAIKIHCHEDDKIFLSDFAAKLDKNGRLSGLTLDGVMVGKFVGRLHEGERRRKQ